MKRYIYMPYSGSCEVREVGTNARVAVNTEFCLATEADAEIKRLQDGLIAMREFIKGLSELMAEEDMPLVGEQILRAVPIIDAALTPQEEQK